MSNYSRCTDNAHGAHEGHCLHALDHRHPHAPGTVCCWCGDIFIGARPSEHGEFLPKHLKRDTQNAEAAAVD